MLKSQTKFKKSNEVIMLPARFIQPNPHQPRKSFNWDDLEGLAGLNSLAYQIYHDVVSGTDRSLNGTGAFAYQLLSISEPHIGTMCQTCDTDKIRNVLRLCL